MLYQGKNNSTLASDELDDVVETNIGSIPVYDYLDIKSIEYGYDGYKDFYNAGYRIKGYKNVKPIGYGGK